MDRSRCGAHELTCLPLRFIANSQGDVGAGAGEGLSGVEADAELAPVTMAAWPVRSGMSATVHRCPALLRLEKQVTAYPY